MVHMMIILMPDKTLRMGADRSLMFLLSGREADGQVKVSADLSRRGLEIP